VFITRCVSNALQTPPGVPPVPYRRKSTPSRCAQLVLFHHLFTPTRSFPDVSQSSSRITHAYWLSRRVFPRLQVHQQQQQQWHGDETQHELPSEIYDGGSCTHTEKRRNSRVVVCSQPYYYPVCPAGLLSLVLFTHVGRYAFSWYTVNSMH